MSNKNKNRNRKPHETPILDELMAEEKAQEQAAQVEQPAPAVEEKPAEVQPVIEEPKPEPQVVPEPVPAEQPMTDEQKKVQELGANLSGSAKEERYPDRLKKSTAASPVKLVHYIAEEMYKADPAIRRKDIINFCIQQGIAFYTARTQVQIWFAAKKRDLEAAAKQTATA